MSVVDDLRKLLQDLVTPDLKALDARVWALEQKVDLQFTALDKKMDMRADALDKKIDHKVDLLMSEIRNLAAVVAANQANVMHALDIDRRVEKIESKMAATN